MFRGRFIHTLDAKKRINIPSKFRRVIPENENGLVLTQGSGGCIDVYTSAEWANVQEKLEKLNMYNQRDLLFLRMILQNINDVEMDSQSRIVIPQSLLDYSGIEGEVLVLGMLKKVELWNPAVYQKYISSADKSYEEAAEEVMRL